MYLQINVEEDKHHILKMSATREKDGRPGKPSGKESQPLIIAKTPAEEQRLKLERLMRNPVSVGGFFEDIFK